MKEKVTIATRGSALALWQAEHVKARLLAISPDLEVAFNVIKTQGDKILDVPLAKVGGKGLFVKEIEQALIDEQADIAVHSMKDVPAELAPGLALAAVSAREVPWDALCAREAIDLRVADGDAARPASAGLADLRVADGDAARPVSAGLADLRVADGDAARPASAGLAVTVATLKQGAVVGTSSMRRQCQLLAARPDLQIKMLRGNVPTRIKKLDDGEFDAIVLAAAGLTRLGMADRITQLLPIELSIPACAQGVLGLETRGQDFLTAELIRRAMHDAAEERRIAAERSFLARMGGSCQTPLAAHAVDRQGGIHIVGMCGMPDGSKILKAEMTGTAADAELLGVRLAEDLLAQGAEAILAATKD